MTSPSLPKSVADWLGLPPLAMGRYLVVNLGLRQSALMECRSLKVPGLPKANNPDESGLVVALPNITVDEAGQRSVYRLPLDFGPVVQAIFDEAGRFHAAGRSLLPCYYTLGMRQDGAFANPDNPVNPPMLVTRN